MGGGKSWVCLLHTESSPSPILPRSQSRGFQFASLRVTIGEGGGNRWNPFFCNSTAVVASSLFYTHEFALKKKSPALLPLPPHSQSAWNLEAIETSSKDGEVGPTSDSRRKQTFRPESSGECKLTISSSQIKRPPPHLLKGGRREKQVAALNGLRGVCGGGKRLFNPLPPSLHWSCGNRLGKFHQTRHQLLASSAVLRRKGDADSPGLSG